MDIIGNGNEYAVSGESRLRKSEIAQQACSSLQGTADSVPLFLQRHHRIASEVADLEPYVRVTAQNQAALKHHVLTEREALSGTVEVVYKRLDLLTRVPVI